MKEDRKIDRFLRFIIISCTMFIMSISYSHSGMTSAEGCHSNKNTSGYHCHKNNLKAKKSHPASREIASIKTNSQIAKKKISYVLFREKVDDTRIKTQVMQHIVVTGIPSKNNLRSEIFRRFNLLKNRKGFRYRSVPTHIYIYVYGSREQAESGMGLWVGMLDWNTSYTAQPSVKFNEDFLSALSKPSEIKHGLSENERKKIFKKLATIEDRAFDKGNRRDEFIEKHKGQVTMKYNISRKQLKDIEVEGGLQGWPM